MDDKQRLEIEEYAIQYFKNNKIVFKDEEGSKAVLSELELTTYARLIVKEILSLINQVKIEKPGEWNSALTSAEIKIKSKFKISS